MVSLCVPYTECLLPKNVIIVGKFMYLALSVMSIIYSFLFFSYLNSSHEIVLRRSHPGSWGFSIVGGYEDNHTNQAFFIKTIVLGTPAYYDGRLK